ncbi:MAG: VTT domain-containing protein [Thiotrichaceae bacterium]
MPLLQGDSLLFAARLWRRRRIESTFLVILLIIAAILGDTTNYWIGYYLGPKVFSKPNHGCSIPTFAAHPSLLSKAWWQDHHYRRFLPIIRTFAPFVAGVGVMDYLRFLMYNIVGGIIWVTSFIYMGYFFGNLPIVKENFSLVILAIIVISLIPPVIEFLKHRHSSDNA